MLAQKLLPIAGVIVSAPLTPSRGHCTASVMTSPQVGGPNAIATSLISTRQSLAFACSSPEPPTTGYGLAHGSSCGADGPGQVTGTSATPPGTFRNAVASRRDRT
jgi:hypothetical protein